MNPAMMPVTFSVSFGLLASMAQVPADLLKDVEKSLRTPQHSFPKSKKKTSTHHEGPFMVSHLELVRQVLTDVANGKFHESVPAAVRAPMQQVAIEQANNALLYVLLHDIDKPNCLTLTYEEGQKVEVTWEEWLVLLDSSVTGHLVSLGHGDLLKQFCNLNGISQISYYQEGRSHGKVAAERLSGRKDIPEIIVKAIREHEIAFTFASRGGINIPLFQDTFGTWTDPEINFALLVNYADQMGSLQENGFPNIEAFELLAKTWSAEKQFSSLKIRLGRERLDKHKVERSLAVLRDSTEAFQGETVEEALERIKSECAIPTYNEERLRAEMSSLVASGVLPIGHVDNLVAVLLTTGQIPSDLGKKLGKANKPVRDALTRAAKG